MRPSRTKHGHINNGIVAFLLILADVFTVATCCHRPLRGFADDFQFLPFRWQQIGTEGAPSRAKQRWRHGWLPVAPWWLTCQQAFSVWACLGAPWTSWKYMNDDSHGPSWTWFHASPCQQCQVSRIGAVIVLPEGSGVHIYEGDKRYNKPTIWGWLILYKP